MAGMDNISATLGAGLAQALEQGNALRAGAEENLQALIQAQLQKLDVVTREEFEAQQALLGQAQARLTELEAEVARLKADQSE